MLQIVIRPSVGSAWVLALGVFMGFPAHAGEINASCPATPAVDLTSLGDPSIAAPIAPGGASMDSASTGPVDRDLAAARAAERARFEQILQQRAALTADRPIDAGLDAAKRASLASDDGVPRKVGESVVLDRTFSFASVAVAPASATHAAPAGDAVRLADGSVIWETSVVSAGATALRLQLRDVDLADGVELFVYNEAGQVQGPFGGKGPEESGEFWTPSVFGDRLRIHVHADSAEAFSKSRFVIAAAMHLGSRFHVADAIATDYMPGPAAVEGTFCGVTVPDCTLNGVCAVSSNPGLAAASDAVAQINFVKGGSGYICTGSLINPTGSLRTPYFLTANHCFDTQTSASSLEAHFRFRTSACDTSCTMAGMLQANGSTLMATGARPSRGDYTLVRLNSVPGGLTMLGWSAGHPVEGAYLIHLGHPAGAPLAYSVRRIRYATSPLPNCTDVPRPTFLYSGISSTSTDAQGGIAGGSSGGPAVLLAAGGGSSYIVGQLFGGCHPGTAMPCDANHDATIDGALEKSFPYLRPFIYERIFSNGFN